MNHAGTGRETHVGPIRKRRMDFLRRDFVFKTALVLAVAVMSGAVLINCSRPASMLVRQGASPAYVDDDVVFRTTYYFRVFDYCEQRKRVDYHHTGIDDPEHRLYTVLKDAMYRFTMTGKADALFTAIHFESGTLKHYEIDPLGSSVVYDANAKRYVWGNPTEAARETARAASDADDARLAQLVQNYKTLARLDDANQLGDVKQRLKAVIEQQAQQGTPNLAADIETVLATLRAHKGVLSPEMEASLQQQFEQSLERHLGPKEIQCPATTAPAKRGFQVLGPEGWRTFEQDERLLMAMSIDAAPLVGILKELSRRVLESRQGDPEFARTLAQEYRRLSSAAAVLAPDYDLQAVGAGECPAITADLAPDPACSAVALRVRALEAALDQETSP